MRRERGFTLIELMVVVAILGVITVIAIPQYLDYIATAKRRATQSNYLNAIRCVKSEFARIAAGNIPMTQARMVLELNGVPGTSVKNHNPYTGLVTDTAYVEGLPTKDGEVGVQYNGFTGGAGSVPQPGDTVLVTAWFVDESGSSAQSSGAGASNSSSATLTYE